MTGKQDEMVLCQICKEEKRLNEVLPGELVRTPVVELIRKKYPEWSSKGFICLADLNHFRTEYVQDVLEAEQGEMSALEEEVVRSLKEHELLGIWRELELHREFRRYSRRMDRYQLYCTDLAFRPIPFYSS